MPDYLVRIECVVAAEIVADAQREMARALRDLADDKPQSVKGAIQVAERPGRV